MAVLKSLLAVEVKSRKKKKEVLVFLVFCMPIIISPPNVPACTEIDLMMFIYMHVFKALQLHNSPYM